MNSAKKQMNWDISSAKDIRMIEHELRNAVEFSGGNSDVLRNEFLRITQATSSTSAIPTEVSWIDSIEKISVANEEPALEAWIEPGNELLHGGSIESLNPRCLSPVTRIRSVDAWASIDLIDLRKCLHVFLDKPLISLGKSLRLCLAHALEISLEAIRNAYPAIQDEDQQELVISALSAAAYVRSIDVARSGIGEIRESILDILDHHAMEKLNLAKSLQNKVVESAKEFANAFIIASCATGIAAQIEAYEYALCEASLSHGISICPNDISSRRSALADALQRMRCVIQAIQTCDNDVLYNPLERNEIVKIFTTSQKSIESLINIIEGNPQINKAEEALNVAFTF